MKLTELAQAFEDGKKFEVDTNKQPNDGGNEIISGPEWVQRNIKTVLRFWANDSSSVRIAQDLISIDLSVLIGTEVDCEFSDYPDFKKSTIGALIRISESNNKKYSIGGDAFTYYKYCRPRMNHRQIWENSRSPLPSGLIVKVRGLNMAWTEASVDDVDWPNIIAFKALRLEDNRSWPWGSMK